MKEDSSTWKGSGNWSAPSHSVQVRPLRTPAAQGNWRRLDAPFYYAENAQILISGNDASLLFTRPHPAVLPDGNLAPAPLREAVALIAMSVAGLKELSKALGDAIRQAEERTRQIEQQSQNPPTNLMQAGVAVSETI